MAVTVKPISKISPNTVLRCLNCGYTDKASKWKEYKGKCFNCKSEAYKEYGKNIKGFDQSDNPLDDFLRNALGNKKKKKKSDLNNKKNVKSKIKNKRKKKKKVSSSKTER